MSHRRSNISSLRIAFAITLSFAIGTKEVAAQVEETCLLTGIVTDVSDDAPLASAHVRLHAGREGGEKMSATGPAGRFSFRAITCGNHVVSVSFVGYATATDTVLVTPEGGSLRIALKPITELFEEILVSAALDARDGGQQRVVVDDEELRRTMPGTFAESLEQVAGVEAITVGVGIAKPVIRGLSMQRVAFVESGLKQEGQQWGADHGLEIDPFAAERVQITKGPASLRHGSDALGGVVELLPPSIPEDGALNAEIAAIYKSNNNHVATTVGVAGRRGVFFSNARVTLQDYGDYRVPADSFQYNGFVLPLFDGRLVNTAGREKNGRISVGFIKSTGIVRLTASRYSLQSGLFPGAVGIPRAYSVLDDGNRRNAGVPRQDVQHDKLFLESDFSLADGTFMLEAGIQQNRRDEHSFPHAHNILTDSSDTVALSLRLTTLSGRVEWGKQSRRLQYNVGFTGQAQTNRRGGFEFLLPDFSSLTGGFYATVAAEPVPRLTITAGGRLDAAQYDLEGYTDRRGTMRAIPLEKRFRNVAASANAYYVSGTTGGWKLGLTLSKSFRIPAPIELSSNGVHHGTFRHEIGDPKLRAEHGYQIDAFAEIGDKHSSVSFSPFFYRFFDFIFLQPTARFSLLPDAGQVYEHTQADALYAGGEITLQAHLLEPITVRISSAFVWNRNLETHLPLPFTPPVSLRGEVKIALTRKPFNDGFVTLIVDTHARQEHVARNELPTSASTLYGLQMGSMFRVFGQPLEIRFDLQNMFDQPYQAHLSRYRILNLPEQGFNLAMSIRLIDLF